MFDVGFSEMVLIGLVALIVLGPERLPKAARMVGAFLRKARMSWDNLRHEVEREIDAEQVRKSMRDVPNPQQWVDEHLNKPLAEVERELGAELAPRAVHELPGPQTSIDDPRQKAPEDSLASIEPSQRKDSP